MATNDDLKAQPAAAEANADAQDSQAAAEARPGGRREFGQGGVSDLLLTDLTTRVARANERLRASLNGSVVVQIRDSGRRFLLDWRTDQPRVAEVQDLDAECVINLSEDSLRRVVSGELNPQVAMLSDKIRVSGRVGLAIYYFNLLAPGPSF